MGNRQLNDGMWQSYVVTQIPDVSADAANQSESIEPAAVQRAQSTSQKPGNPIGFYQIAFYSLIGVMLAQFAITYFDKGTSSTKDPTDLSQEVVRPPIREHESLPDSFDQFAGSASDPAISGHLRTLLEKQSSRVEPILDENQSLITARRHDANVKR